MTLPELPEPVEIEIELTNLCNARCTVCPRSDMPASGMMRLETLERILDGYTAARPGFALNRLRGELSHPRVSVAGGGEPLLHREAPALLRHMVARGFSTHLITNGSRLRRKEIGDCVVATHTWVRVGLNAGTTRENSWGEVVLAVIRLHA